jgi:lipid II:glycine glycyltransferase (peptidoglycan interpeptide bridge formation enzyme)
MSQPLDTLYTGLPKPKHVWITSPESRGAGAEFDADATWDAFVAAHPNGHILQTARWAQLKSAFGWAAQRAELRTIPSPDAPLLGGASILFRRLPWGQTVAYVPKGPVVDWAAADQTRAVLTMAREFARKQHAALLKIEPELPDTPEVSARLAGYGFVRSPQRVQPLSTIHIDLAADDETILARMKPKWRYNVRLAERKGVAVRDGFAADLPAIQKLMDVTGERDGFGVHSAEYHAAATAIFQPAGLMTWLLAEAEGETLAAIAVFALGARAWYMWGASGESGRNLMPNHALQWAAMRWAKARGCTLYDLWGIPAEVGANPDAYTEPESWGEGGLWGVYRFKQGFGGQVVRYTGAWDLPLSAPGYALYKLALRVKRGRGDAGAG